MTFEQAVMLMAAAKGLRWRRISSCRCFPACGPEARALRWHHVVALVDDQWQPVVEAGFDSEQVAVFVWRAERAGGDIKTPKSPVRFPLGATAVTSVMAGTTHLPPSHTGVVKL